MHDEPTLASTSGRLRERLTPNASHTIGTSSGFAVIVNGAPNTLNAKAGPSAISESGMEKTPRRNPKPVKPRTVASSTNAGSWPLNDST